MSTSALTALRHFRNQPFELLVRLESQLRRARRDLVASHTEVWTGLAFRLAGESLLVPRDEVREVMPPPALTRVPNGRAWLLGIANVRGELLTLVDLQQALGGSAPEARRSQRALVLNAPRLSLGFLVDEVVGYREFRPEEQRVPESGEGDPLRPFELGGFERDGERWRVVSLHQLAFSEGLRQAGW